MSTQWTVHRDETAIRNSSENLMRIPVIAGVVLMIVVLGLQVYSLNYGKRQQRELEALRGEQSENFKAVVGQMGSFGSQIAAIEMAQFPIAHGIGELARSDREIVDTIRYLHRRDPPTNQAAIEKVGKTVAQSVMPERPLELPVAAGLSPHFQPGKEPGVGYEVKIPAGTGTRVVEILAVEEGRIIKCERKDNFWVIEILHPLPYRTRYDGLYLKGERPTVKKGMVVARGQQLAVVKADESGLIASLCFQRPTSDACVDPRPFFLRRSEAYALPK